MNINTTKHSILNINTTKHNILNINITLLTVKAKHTNREATYCAGSSLRGQLLCRPLRAQHLRCGCWPIHCSGANFGSSSCLLPLNERNERKNNKYSKNLNTSECGHEEYTHPTEGGVVSLYEERRAVANNHPSEIGRHLKKSSKITERLALCKINSKWVALSAFSLCSGNHHSQSP